MFWVLVLVELVVTSLLGTCVQDMGKPPEPTTTFEGSGTAQGLKLAIRLSYLSAAKHGGQDKVTAGASTGTGCTYKVRSRVYHVVPGVTRRRCTIPKAVPYVFELRSSKDGGLNGGHEGFLFWMQYRILMLRKSGIQASHAFALPR